MMALMFCCDGILVGFVDSEETISSGRLLRNAPKQFIVLGTCHMFSVSSKKMDDGGLTPLNPMHFKPTSLINSAVWTD